MIGKKLKTLNDLKFEGHLESGGTRYIKKYKGQRTNVNGVWKNSEDVYPSDELADVEELRQEAIHEIKFAKSKDGTKGLFDGGIDFMFTKDVVEYIKWKNNITGKDLK